MAASPEPIAWRWMPAETRSTSRANEARPTAAGTRSGANSRTRPGALTVDGSPSPPPRHRSDRSHSGNLAIGAKPGEDGGDCYLGRLDEVRITKEWQSALAPEVKTEMSDDWRQARRPSRPTAPPDGGGSDARLERSVLESDVGVLRPTDILASVLYLMMSAARFARRPMRSSRASTRSLGVARSPKWASYSNRNSVIASTWERRWASKAWSSLIVDSASASIASLTNRALMLTDPVAWELRC
jgi:hypothetical protein